VDSRLIALSKLARGVTLGGVSSIPTDPNYEQESDVEDQPKTQTPRKYKVIFHNDDYTTMEYVVVVLREFFFKTETEAAHIMLTVHKRGNAVAGIYPRDIAETKVVQVMEHAKEYGMPLMVTSEPEET
jgi:ATP-dependent Clp protease adaptor protein ClpS